jgi:beta-glucosidase
MSVVSHSLLTPAERADELLGRMTLTEKACQVSAVMVAELLGIATADDSRRVAYTAAALGHLGAAIADGAEVRGYLHWSLLDNFEWGRWEPTFGLIRAGRRTFARTPKPSLAWLGGAARGNGAAFGARPAGAEKDPR